MGAPQGSGDFEAYKDDLEAAERRVAGEIQPGARALVVSILVFVLLCRCCCRTPAVPAASTC